MEKKIVKHYDDFGFGFQVRILNAPMAKARGEWVLDLDQRRLKDLVLVALCHKPVRLSGNEIRFVRAVFEMTTTQFGAKFDVSHAAVLKWEKAGSHASQMNWSTEKDIRLFIASKISLKPADFISVYRELEEKADETEMLVKVDGKLAA